MLVELVAACDAMTAVVAAVDPALLSGVQCADLVELLASVEKRCAGLRAVAGVRAGQCRAYRDRGFSNTQAWMAHAAGCSGADAERTLRTGRDLVLCPATAAAVAAGVVSLTQAHEICRTEAGVPGSEDEMLSLAQSSGAGLRTLRDEGRRRRLDRVDPDERYRQQRRERYLRFWTDSAGMICGSFALPPDAGVRLQDRVDLETDRLYREARTTGDANREESAEAEVAKGDRRQRLAVDALLNLVSGQAKTRPGRTELVLVCDIAAYQRGFAEPGELAHLIGGGPLPVRVIQEMAVGAFIKAVLHDGVRIETVAHYHRYRPAHLQTALDLGAAPLFLGAACVDCQHRVGLEWDHVDPVGHGGVTGYENLVPRCFPCHREKTRRDREAGLIKVGPPRRRPTATTSQAA